jgi:hypothetical protein
MMMKINNKLDNVNKFVSLDLNSLNENKEWKMLEQRKRNKLDKDKETLVKKLL